MDYEALFSKGADIMESYSQHDRNKIIPEYNDDLAAIAAGIHHCMHSNETESTKINFLRTMIDTAFLVGYDAGLKK